MTATSIAAKRAELETLSKATLIEKVLESDRKIHELTEQLGQQKNKQQQQDINKTVPHKMMKRYVSQLACHGN